jgi:hypothetical protein
MKRTLPVCALLLGLPLVASAAPPNLPSLVVKMTVQPKAAPKPALKYQLLPELREMNPGNPVQGYLKCFMEQSAFFGDKKILEDREKWRAMPPKDLPLKEMQYYCTNAGLRQADYAARLDTPDWQILLKLKSDGFNLLLPDAQKLRALAGALEIRFRIEIAERRFADAITTAKTMLALARHFNDHPTAIGGLIGVAIGSIALGKVDEMIERPGCPNLFWALTDLPSPFIDLRKALQGERTLIQAVLPDLDDYEPMTEAKLRKIVERLQKEINGPKADNGAVRDWFEGRAKNKEQVQAARKRLVEALAPTDATRFDSFPPLQIILLDAKLDYETVRDEGMKALALPYWKARRLLESIPPIPADKQTPLIMLMTVYNTVKRAQARLDQRIALLRCVEALRIYAAENDGKLPAKLDDIPLPLPFDPATGKPFTYKVEVKTAHLHGEPLGLDVRYEVTIGK